MPTSAQISWSNAKLAPAIDPEGAKTIAVKIAPAGSGLTVKLARGTVLGEIAETPGVFAAYAGTNTDGTQNARVVLAYDIVVDDAGNITFTDTAGVTAGEHGEEATAAPVYYAGTFSTADLVGLDATAAAALGRLIKGTVTAGLLRMA